jgi:lipopolysaccharide biosynthesis protein
LAEEIYRTLANIEFRADLFVSTDTPDKLDVLKRVFGGWRNGAAELRLVPNRGRDVAPKFVAFRAALESYDLLLFLHSKKSGHRETGAQWREMLLQTLVGSPEIVASIIYAFYRFPSLGVVFPQHCEHVRPYVQWLGNFYVARRLAHRMGFNLKPDGFLDFPSGSMFWARSAALRPLVQLGLQIRDFAEEKGQIDGTTAHAIERLVLYACEHAGLTWTKVANPSFFCNRSTIVTIASPNELDDFVFQHRVTLLRSGNRRSKWLARLVRLRSGAGRLLNTVGH